MPIDALSVLCAQLTRDLLAIAKFLLIAGRRRCSTWWLSNVTVWKRNSSALSNCSLIHGVVSGLIAVIETFASVKKFDQFVDVTCGAEARPSWTCIYQLGQDRRTEDLVECNRNSCMPCARRRRKPYIVLAQESSRVLAHSLKVDWRWLPQVPWCCWQVEYSVRLEECCNDHERRIYFNFK